MSKSYSGGKGAQRSGVANLFDSGSQSRDKSAKRDKISRSAQLEDIVKTTSRSTSGSESEEKIAKLHPSLNSESAKNLPPQGKIQEESKSRREKVSRSASKRKQVHKSSSEKTSPRRELSHKQPAFQTSPITTSPPTTTIHTPEEVVEISKEQLPIEAAPTQPTTEDATTETTPTAVSPETVPVIEGIVEPQLQTQPQPTKTEMEMEAEAKQEERGKETELVTEPELQLDSTTTPAATVSVTAEQPTNGTTETAPVVAVEPITELPPTVALLTETDRQALEKSLSEKHLSDSEGKVEKKLKDKSKGRGSLREGRREKAKRVDSSDSRRESRRHHHESASVQDIFGSEGDATVLEAKKLDVIPRRSTQPSFGVGDDGLKSNEVLRRSTKKSSRSRSTTPSKSKESPEGKSKSGEGEIAEPTGRGKRRPHSINIGNTVPGINPSFGPPISHEKAYSTLPPTVPENGIPSLPPMADHFFLAEEDLPPPMPLPDDLPPIPLPGELPLGLPFPEELPPPLPLPTDLPLPPPVPVGQPQAHPRRLPLEGQDLRGIPAVYTEPPSPPAPADRQAKRRSAVRPRRHPEQAQQQQQQPLQPVMELYPGVSSLAPPRASSPSRTSTSGSITSTSGPISPSLTPAISGSFGGWIDSQSPMSKSFNSDSDREAYIQKLEVEFFFFSFHSTRNDFFVCVPATWAFDFFFLCLQCALYMSWYFFCRSYYFLTC